MKQLQFVKRQHASHWVGDGFPVRNIFSYADMAQQLSPFLLLDYAGPAIFEPTTARRGVGQHPHRGFETVTIVYAGEVEHCDSTGAGGTMGPGDVQWMTAAGGILHEEYHASAYARRGGPFEVAQLWVNLPARHKADPPGYQSLTDARIPRVELPDGAGSVRVIAGEFMGQRGPARSFTPMNVWDVRLGAGRHVELSLPAGHTTALLLQRGRLVLPGGEALVAADFALFERADETLALAAAAGEEDARLLLMVGEPIDEPVVGQGPFVMNTAAEIEQAFIDHRNGRLAQPAAVAASAAAAAAAARPGQAA